MSSDLEDIDLENFKFMVKQLKIIIGNTVFPISDHSDLRDIRQCLDLYHLDLETFVLSVTQNPETRKIYKIAKKKRMAEKNPFATRQGTSFSVEIIFWMFNVEQSLIYWEIEALCCFLDILEEHFSLKFEIFRVSHQEKNAFWTTFPRC